MIFDETEPLHLLFGKLDVTGISSEGPLLEVIVDSICKGSQLTGTA